jgi:hypothetical protein
MMESRLMAGERHIRSTRLITVLACAALLSVAQAQTGQGGAGAGQPGTGAPVNTLKEAFQRLYGCWKAPAERVNPMDITVVVSFNRSGEIMGHPRITYESAQATDHDRLAYRVAVMETLQRCTPMPFTETMAGAVAGHPFAILFRTVKPQGEKKAWLSPKIL